LFLKILVYHLRWILWPSLQDHVGISFDKSSSRGVWDSSGINTCIKSPEGVDGGPSEDQVSTRNICVKNNINEDINELLWKYKKGWRRRSRGQREEAENVFFLSLNMSLFFLYIPLFFYIIYFELPHAMWEG
jgi:hypothetical protein